LVEPSATRGTTAGVAELSGLKKLRTLNLARTRVTDAGLADVARLPELWSLHLSFTAVTDAGMGDVARLTKLFALFLDGTKITDAGVAEISVMTTLGLLADVRAHARREFARPLEQLDPSERWRALAFAVRDRMMDRLVETTDRYEAANAKRVAYLSMEFLVGRSLANNLHNMGLFDAAREVMSGLGTELADVLD